MPVVLELPERLRSELKAPLGPVFTDAETLLADAGAPIVTVGDIVTYHLLEAGHTPAVALTDGRTERTAVDDDVRQAIGGFDRRVTVENPPGTLTDALLEALADAVAGADRTLIAVDGEEDLATLPAILAAPAGASVVYGQPGDGMVLVTCDEHAKTRARELIEAMDGDQKRALGIVA
ncbi:MAG: GTP-dependent dephospho-CoA kinase family protein [Haloarculaceae archaeon]